MPVPAPAVTFVTALLSRPAPLSPQRLAPPPDARHPRCPDRLNRPKPGRGLAEATEQPRATTGYGSLWAGCAAATAQAIGATSRPVPSSRPTLPLLRRAARCLFVVNDHHARAGGRHARELQLLLATGLGEQRLARAEQNGMNHEPQLVDE